MIDFFIESYKNTPIYLIILEAIAFVFGVISVYFAKKEHIWVYPTGIICTVISVYLLYLNQLFGDMTINIYYSFMSIYGWILWNTKTANQDFKITLTNNTEKLISFFIFCITLIFTYLVYLYFDYQLKIFNCIDIFTSGLFFTAMWLMAKKKLENWILWIIADVISVPLYAYRGLGMLSLQYIIFTIIAIFAYLEWRKKTKNN